MKSDYSIKISVRELVEYVLKSGDLHRGIVSKKRLTDAIKAHIFVQESSPDGYQAEVSLKHTIHKKNIEVVISGRADGILTENDTITIDEIKTTYIPLHELNSDNRVHWAQACCYAYIYSLQNELSNITVSLTYFHMESKRSKVFDRAYTFEDLQIFFDDITNKYFFWVEKRYQWLELRNQSIENLCFPFNTYRKGQESLIENVMDTIESETKLFVQAPTGIGKTIAALFPTIKKMRSYNLDKIFYLTAKNTGHQIALDALSLMHKQGLKFKNITINAKEKVCFCKGIDSKECPFSIGYFDRIDKALEDILQEEVWTIDIIEKYASKHNICPHEFSLDLALWSDIIICDYNYAFDPRVYLRRFFLENKGDYCFLIDEAHNLVDRARTMFSAVIEKKKILKVRKELKSHPHIAKELYKANLLLLQLIKDKQQILSTEICEELVSLLESITNIWEQDFAKGTVFTKEAAELYFEMLTFIRVWKEFYDDSYISHLEIIGKNVCAKLLCLNPAKLLQKLFSRASSAILFSATLIPLDYFKSILGGVEEDVTLELTSPFPPQNMGLFIANNINTSYKYRHLSYSDIADYIATVAKGKIGNYLVFFPSYVYLNAVLPIFEEKYSEIDVLKQNNTMDAEERKNFLDKFTPKKKNTFVAFVVMGGIFSEGIDLSGEKLSGVIIVGVGLPQICTERNLISQYFQEQNKNGFSHAYLYPGMNKVMQAGGRLIRTENDVGVILLIGQRFEYSSYRNIMPAHWHYYYAVNNCEKLAHLIKTFWNYPRNNK